MSIPTFEVEIDKDGKLVSPPQEQAILSFLASADGQNITDAIVFSHGWNNDMAEARKLYSDFLQNLDKEPTLQKSHQAILIGLLWPSKRFDDASLIPGGAASTDNDAAADALLLKRVEDMKALLSDPGSQALLDQMKPLVSNLHNDTQKQADFVRLLGHAAQPFVDRSQISDDEGRRQLTDDVDGPKLLATLSAPIAPRVETTSGGAAELSGQQGVGLGGNPALGHSGGAAALGDIFSGIKAGALRLLNFVTYYVMKDRAGKIGRDTINPLVSRIQQALSKTQRTHSVSFHLVGHSFGGRLVTAVVDGPEKLNVQTLLLLQGAFSHNGLSSDFDGQGKKGFFSSIVSQHKVTGPILITHSKNDSAVGLAYPIASRVNGVDSARFGDANDRFGGMGANGAQHVPEKTDIALLNATGTYNFSLPGVQVYNLNGDSIITSHGDVARPETAHLLAMAMAAEKAAGAGTLTAAGV